MPPKLAKVLEDTYSEQVLRKRYNSVKTMLFDCCEINRETGLNIRNLNVPEDVSENIVKFILRNKGLDCKWAKTMGIIGDLVCDGKMLEVKGFTSDGPASFGPRKKFDGIYFLDMMRLLDDKLVLWKVDLTHESPAWKSLKMSKTETHEDQSSQGRRPRISFEKIRQQIGECCSIIYDGSFEGIFTVKESVVPQ